MGKDEDRRETLTLVDSDKSNISIGCGASNTFIIKKKESNYLDVVIIQRVNLDKEIINFV